MRSSGVLLHVSSLPGPHGIGDLGSEAHRFVGFLASAGQRWWQMFPLGPPGISNSPYQVLSAFAGNPLLISLDSLCAQGLLPKADLVPPVPLGRDHVNFEEVWRFKKPLFRRAFAKFETDRKKKARAFDAFRAEQSFWLDDYALFCALKEKHLGVSWTDWEPEYRERKPAALAKARRELYYQVRYHQFLQFQFFTQWRALREACSKAGVKLMGDVPIFVAHDSADVWAHPGLFSLDKRGRPLFVAGVPPDYFSRTGQRWGNPLYRWDVLKKRGYDWWLDRFRAIFQFFDAARLDHFIGFQNYWRIPAADKNALRGKWVKGPGAPFFEAVFRKFGKLHLIAEDLGAITEDVKALRDKFKLPGMRVLQFGFGDGGAQNPFLPHNYPACSVAYTGTHDNDTIAGWFGQLDARTRRRVLAYANSNGRDVPWDLIRLTLASASDTAIIPAQDLLGLGSNARINLPGTPIGNWSWRLRPAGLGSAVAKRLRILSELYGRS